jgi:hypothetical protein
MGAGTTKIQYSTGLLSATNPLPVSLTPSSGVSAGYVSTLSFTRPTNTTQYGANDVIGINDAGSAGNAIHTFTSAGPAGGNVKVTRADLTISLASVTAAMTTFRLHLYDASPTAILDNAVFDLVTADKAKHLGFIDFAQIVDYGSQLFISATPNLQVKLATSVTSLYGQLVTAGAFIPTSGEAYQVRLFNEAM